MSENTEVLPTLIRALKGVREQKNLLTQREEALREQIMPLLEEMGGRYVDEVAGLEAYIAKSYRGEYDPTRLHRLVEDGLILDNEFAACLKTVVDAAVVKDWVRRGIITDRQLQRADAWKPTAAITKLEIKPIKAREVVS